MKNDPDGLKIAVNSFFLSRIPYEALDEEGDTFDVDLIGKMFDSHAHLGVTKDKEELGGLTEPIGPMSLMTAGDVQESWDVLKTVAVE